MILARESAATAYPETLAPLGASSKQTIKDAIADAGAFGQANLPSAVTMAMAVRSAQTGFPKATVSYLIATMLLGLTFLVVKFFEYKHKYDHHHIPGANFHFEGPYAEQVELFMSLYFALTGLHALHMVIGFGLLSVITWMAWKGRFSPQWYTPVEMSGLYWHFVDIVWIFLFPLLYLVDRAHQVS